MHNNNLYVLDSILTELKAEHVSFTLSLAVSHFQRTDQYSPDKTKAVYCFVVTLARFRPVSSMTLSDSRLVDIL